MSNYGCQNYHAQDEKRSADVEHKSRVIFKISDVDADGFLNYEEMNQLTERTSDGQTIDEEQYNDVCKVVGADPAQ
eukprot:gene10371-61309_t